MDEDGPIYSGARARLIGELTLAKADVGWLRSKVDDLVKLDALPGDPTFEAVGQRFNELVGRIPGLEEPLEDSTELYESAVAKVSELCRHIRDARKRANIIDGASRPSDVAAMQSAARSTAEALEHVGEAIRDLLVPYQLKRQLH